MPVVGTSPELREAVDSFDAAPLGLTATPEALDEAAASVARSGLLLLGETHGVRETPVLVRELMGLLGLTGLALEWGTDLAPVVRAWAVDGTTPAPEPGSAADAELWCGDGRLTAGHWALLRDLAAAGSPPPVLMDGVLAVSEPAAADSVREVNRRWWSQRDAEMAGRVLAAPPAPGGTLVAAGSLHTRLTEIAEGVPLGARLLAERPGLRAVSACYGRGTFYNLGRRRFRRSRWGAAEAPQLTVHEGGLMLVVPRPTEATVPHRLPRRR